MTAATPIDTGAITSLPDVNHRVITVSSAQAAEWLETYKGPNRNISDMQVLKYQTDMENGRWHFDAAPIRFFSDGRLLDGQHRLTALANTVPAMEIPFLVVDGLDSESQLVMDQNQVRTVGQNLSLKGVKNASVVAASTKLYLDWTNGRLFKSAQRGATTKSEAQAWALEHPHLFGQVFCTDVMSVDCPASVAAAFALHTMQFAPARTTRFINQLASGAGLAEGDPILALDRRLRNIRRHGQKVSQREYLAYFIKAWNAWVSGSSLQRMQLGGNLTAESFPVVMRVRDISPLS